MPLARSSVGNVLTTVQLGSLKQASTAITQLFTGSSTWSPATTALTGVTAGNLLVSLGGWWDSNHGNGGTMSMPTNTNGTFLASANPTLPDGVIPPGWPVHGQIAHILSAAAGTHTVTPQNIAGSGDGYFLIAEFGASAGSAWTLVDSGSALARSGTVGAIDGVTVTTAGAFAQVGDLVIAVGVTDGNPSAVGIGSPTVGTWNNLLTTTTTTTNIGMGAAWRIATAPGAQSAAWVWADNDCEIGAAVIAVFHRG